MKPTTQTPHREARAQAHRFANLPHTRWCLAALAGGCALGMALWTHTQQPAPLTTGSERETRTIEEEALLTILYPVETEAYLRQFKTPEQLAAEEQAVRAIMDPLQFGDRFAEPGDAERLAYREEARAAILDPVGYNAWAEQFKTEEQRALEAEALKAISPEPAALGQNRH